jgi:endonuclease G
MNNYLRYALVSLLFYFQSNAQNIDTIVDKGIYKSYYSFGYKSPLYVVYDLTNGGGDASRAKMNFKEEYKTPKNKDYAKSGFDKGHLVNAEDFAFDSNLEKLTFSYYNCFAQNPKLNRGSWKSWETTIRNESKKWPLRIYIGAIYGNRKLNNIVAVPEYCWKVVYNLKTGLLMHALIFKNDETAEVNRITIDELKKMLNYNIEFKKK